MPDNGTVIDIEDGERMHVHKQKVPSAPMVVDGFTIGDIQEVVIRDRQSLAKDGMFVIIASVNLKTGKLRKSPDIISRGFIYLRESQNLLNEARILIKKTIEDSTRNMNPIDLDYVMNNLTDVLAGFPLRPHQQSPDGHPRPHRNVNQSFSTKSRESFSTQQRSGNLLRIGMRDSASRYYCTERWRRALPGGNR